MKGMANRAHGSRRFRLVGLASLVLAGLTVGVQPVAATAPDVLELDVYGDGPADWLSCGFPVYEVGHDHITLTTFLDSDGNPRETVLRVIGAWTETNLETGKSVTQNVARTYFNAFSGTPTMVGEGNRIASGGVILLDAGLITWSFEDGTVYTIAGPHPTFYDGVDWCALLAG